MRMDERMRGERENGLDRVRCDDRHRADDSTDGSNLLRRIRTRFQGCHNRERQVIPDRHFYDRSHDKLPPQLFLHIVGERAGVDGRIERDDGDEQFWFVVFGKNKIFVISTEAERSGEIPLC